MCLCIPDRIGIWKCWFLRRGENRSTRRKTSRNKGENQQQFRPTYDVDAGIWTRATLVGGECSRHCSTLAPVLNKLVVVVIVSRFLGQPRNKQRKVGRWLGLFIGRGFPTSGRCSIESGNRVILHCWRGAHWHDRKSCGAWQQYWNIQLWYSTSWKNWKGNYRSRQVTRYVRLRYLESLA